MRISTPLKAGVENKPIKEAKSKQPWAEEAIQVGAKSQNPGEDRREEPAVLGCC